LKPRDELQNQPQTTAFDISGQISSIRHLQSKTLDNEMAGLNLLEKRLEQERAKFLAIIRQKDKMIE
jgi:hypothetical protein